MTLAKWYGQRTAFLGKKIVNGVQALIKNNSKRTLNAFELLEINFRESIVCSLIESTSLTKCHGSGQSLSLSGAVSKVNSYPALPGL